MEIIYNENGTLRVKDDKKEIVLFDLVKINGYHIEGDPDHYWVLVQVKELLKDGSIVFNLGTALYPDGSYSEIYFGYFTNNINRRTIEINKDGTIRSDYIILFDPCCIGNQTSLYSTITKPIKLEDYLSDENRYYENYNKSERVSNSILSDYFLEKFIEHNKRLANLLNYYCEDSGKLKAIFKNYEDDNYINDLEREIRRNPKLVPTLPTHDEK